MKYCGGMGRRNAEGIVNGGGGKILYLTTSRTKSQSYGQFLPLRQNNNPYNVASSPLHWPHEVDEGLKEHTLQHQVVMVVA